MATEAKGPELIPCPFCGGIPVLDGFGDDEYVCEACDLWGITPDWWNKRAPDMALLVDAANAYMRNQTGDTFDVLMDTVDAIERRYRIGEAKDD